jgi:predicted alpha/beta-fold hydrolase
VRSASRIYWPAFFYYEGHLQTIFGLVKRLPASHKLPYKREELTMSDGGIVGLDYLDSDEPVVPENRKRLNVLFFPGLTSSSQTSYVKTLVMALNRVGANVIVFNNRGIGGLELKVNIKNQLINCN